MHDELSQLIRKIETGELPDEWIVGPKSRPADLCDYLEKNNFTKRYTLTGMAIDLMKMDSTVIVPQNVTIMEVENSNMLKQWTDIISNGLFHGNAFEAELFESLVNQPQFKFYLAYLNGAPVAASMLQFSNGVATIDLVATLSEHWRKGIGTAMTKTPLVYARDMGYKVGVLQASMAGEHGYRKIGFEEYCKFNAYKFQTPD